MRSFRQMGLAVVGASALAAAGVANAAIDVTAVTSAITDATTATAGIAASVVLIFLGIKVFKWVRSAL